MIPTDRKPTHPGEILAQEFLEPLGMTQTALAEQMGVPIQRVNTIIGGKRGVTADTARLLSRVLETTPWFWLNLQMAFDLWEAQQKDPRDVAVRQVIAANRELGSKSAPDHIAKAVNDILGRDGTLKGAMSPDEARRRAVSMGLTESISAD